MATIGLITGSGTYAMEGVGEAQDVDTRFGSVPVRTGTLGGVDVAHISRHREGHVLLSSQVTHQANISALKELGVDAIVAVTVCGACDPGLDLSTVIVFDDLHFPVNRLPDGSVCTLHTEPGAPGRGHWVFDDPFHPLLREALLGGCMDAGLPLRNGGTYGHVDGPRFNTKSEIRQLMGAGVTAVSQTAGPETVLAGEADIPYALLGYATDYANGVKPEDPTPVEELIRLVDASAATFAAALAATLPRIDAGSLTPNGTHFSWD